MTVLLSRLCLSRSVGFLRRERLIIAFDEPFKTFLPLPTLKGWQIDDALFRPDDAIPDRINHEDMP